MSLSLTCLRVEKSEKVKVKEIMTNSRRYKRPFFPKCSTLLTILTKTLVIVSVYYIFSYLGKS